MNVNSHYPHYYDTNNLPLKELEAQTQKAISQENLVRELFKLYPRWTAMSIEYATERMPKLPTILFTSARRVLTNLSKGDNALIIKTDKQIKTKNNGHEHIYLLRK